MADPNLNPFSLVNSTEGAAEAPVANPFDVFGAPSAHQPVASEETTSAETPLSNPFEIIASQLPPFENMQIEDKAVNEPTFQQQQPWQAPVGNGQHNLPPQHPQVAMEQPPQDQPGAPQLSQQPISTQPPLPQAEPATLPLQNPFAWTQSPQPPIVTPSVENPWHTNLQPVHPVPTPFDSISVASQPPAPSQQVSNPFITPNVPTAFPQVAAYSNAIIPSQQTSNPYSGFVVQQSPHPSHAMVPAPQPSSQWSVGGSTTVPRAVAAFDPFAPSPPPAPAPLPTPVSPPAPMPEAQSHDFLASDAMVPANSVGYPGVSTSLVPALNAAYPGGLVPVDASQAYAQQPPIPAETQLVATQTSEYGRSDGSHETGDRSSAGDEHRQMVPYKPDDDVPNDRQLAVVPDDDIEKPKRNLFSEALAKNAPPGSAPLPKADLVVKSGFVLSRISFRTIVMKKWKQSYWVQYGPHTMLWFRSQADFDDWLNNPYHTPSQRNFLIKLAVNFVHDLYKPNVRGYQVTQARTKSYGREQIKQFKLERWMDYGPTIAAAFGSQDPKEVDNLRQALVECMRNTPLDGGIRATGAVRQDNDGRPRDSTDEEDHLKNYSYDSERMAGASYEDDHDRSQNRHDDSNEQQRKDAPSIDNEQSKPPAPTPVTGDLLDDSFFDVPLNTDQTQPSVPMQGPPVAAAPSNYYVPHQNYTQPVPPQAYAQPVPPQASQAYAQPYPHQGYAQQPPPHFQQQVPGYSQPSQELHYYGFPPIPSQYQQQQQTLQQQTQQQQQQHPY